MRILHSADWHILLHKKNIPYDWQKNRFELFFNEIFKLEKECDIHIMAGDLFNEKPQADETPLALKFFNRASIPTYIIPGNHEATKKGSSFLESFTEEYVISNDNIHIICENTRLEIMGQYFQFFPYGAMQTNKLPKYHEGDILVSHIRGEVPPHITPEYDFEKLRPWKLILLGDLHFNHQYQNYPAFYPGSPMNVTFDRDENREYGVNIVDFRSIDDYTIEIKYLKLPKLIRKTITSKDSMIKDDFHHTIYEVTGSIDELAKISNHELLDKRISHNIETASQLDLNNKTISEELLLYLKYIKIEDIKGVIKEFNNL